SLVLGLWLPERGVWVDEHGRELAIPSGTDRGVTYLGEQLAVMVHDGDLLDQPRLLEAVGSAGRLALENERLQAELRAQLAELARGIHPAVLTDQGLAAAGRTLAARAPIPVEVAGGEERLPAHVETAAYFVVAEALANVARYAQARQAWVSLARANGAARVEV